MLICSKIQCWRPIVQYVRLNAGIFDKYNKKAQPVQIYNVSNKSFYFYVSFFSMLNLARIKQK